MGPMIALKISRYTLHVSLHPMCACTTQAPHGCASTARNIYSWSNYTPLGKVRVVMIGQDPYHGPGQAHGTRWASLSSSFPPRRDSCPQFFLHLAYAFLPTGLCFSVPPGVTAPPSLKNVSSRAYLYPFIYPQSFSPLTPVTHDLAGAPRFIRKSKPNMGTSFRRSTGAFPPTPPRSSPLCFCFSISVS